MKKINKIHEKIKLKAFEKITVGRKHKEKVKRKIKLQQKMEQKNYFMRSLKEQTRRLMK